MKSRIITATALILLSITTYGQIDIDKESPRAGLQKARKEYSEAVKRGDSPRIIRTLIQEFTYANMIDSDSILPMITKIEQRTGVAPTVESQLLHLILADIYLKYYSADSWNINNRTPITGTIPAEISTWSTNIFEDTIIDHITAALSSVPALTSVIADDYSEIVAKGAESAKLNHTLYDLVTERAVDILTALDSQTPYGSIKPLTDTLYMAPVEEFVNLKITAERENLVLLLYQNLLDYYIESGHSDALLLADLNRLNYLYSRLESNSKREIYLRSLEQLNKKYSKSSYRVEIMASLANLLITPDYSQPDNSVSEEDLQRALSICEEGLRLYPSYDRINLLNSIKNRVLQPEVRATINNNVYPGKEQKITLTYKNISTVKLTLNRLEGETIEYKNNGVTDDAKKQIITKTYALKSRVIYSDSSFTLTIPSTGYYELIVTTDECKTTAETLYFTSSRLSAVARSKGERGYEILVCDLISGKPIEGATAKIYETIYHGKRIYKQLATANSDKNGVVTIKNLNNNRSYQIVYKDDRHGDIHSFPYRSAPHSIKERRVVSILTDRGVYRPGQVVYFKTIAWGANSEKMNIIPNEKISLSLRNANNQEIATKDVVTNEYGSATGSFILPSDLLNGYFTITTDNGSASFQVAEYKRPKFEIKFDPITTAYRYGDQLTLKGCVKSYSGVQMSDREVSYTITHNSHFMRSSSIPSVTGMTQTDGNGNFSITFATEKLRQPSHLPIWRAITTNYSVTVTVTSHEGETHESSYNINIGDNPFIIDLDLSERINKSTPQRVRVTAINLNGAPLSEVVNYNLYLLKPLTGMEESYDMETLPIEREILSGDHQTGSGSDIKLNFSNLDSGAYLFKVTGADGKVEEKRVFYLYSESDAKPPYKTYRWIVHKNLHFSPKKDAEIVFGTSAENLYLLYELSDGQNILERKRLLLSDENKRFSIPYQSKYGNKAITLTLTFIKDEKFFSDRITLQSPDENRALSITTGTFRDHLRPGEQEEWSFMVKNAKGEPVAAELLAGMFDASLNAITPFKWHFNPATTNQPNSIGNWIWRSDQTQTRYLQFYFSNITLPSFQFDKFKYHISPLYKSNNTYGKLKGVFAENDIVVTGAAPSISDQTRANKESLSSSLTNIDPSLKTPQDEGANQIRQNFRETAFFYPQLRTDKEGSVSISFTVPEATTTWQFMALAHTPEIYVGRADLTTVTSKEFMVSTNLPRFIRDGDMLNLYASVNNLSDIEQRGDIYLELFSPHMEKVITRIEKTFSVAKGATSTTSFEIKAPENVELIGCRIVAKTKEFSDGEQYLLPVVPNKVMITETTPIFISKPGEFKYDIQLPKGADPYALTLEMTANPLWYAVMALPSINNPRTENITNITAAYYAGTIAAAIAHNNPEITKALKVWSENSENLCSPLEQNEELKQTILQLTPWSAEAQSETERIDMLSELLDENRQNYIYQQNRDKLIRMQKEDGGWGWFGNFSSSRFMTANVLEATARVTTIGTVEHGNAVKTMQIKAINFLDRAIIDDFTRNLSLGYNQILYLYVRSSFRDIPLTDVLPVHNHYMGLLREKWMELSLYEKALTATIMHRYGDTALAKRILNSLREYSTTNDKNGIYWANNRSNYYTNSAIQTHVAIINAFYEIEGDSQDLDLMKVWLLKQKQTLNWGDVPSTVDAIFALTMTGKNQLTAGKELTIKVGKQRVVTPSTEHSPGYIKKRFEPSELNSKKESISITKEDDRVSWGGIYYQYLQPLDKIKSASGGIGVDKELFIKQNDKNNRPLLVPLGYGKDQKILKRGDLITVRLTLNIEQDMQFVLLSDLRAGSFEPTQQLSGGRWQGGVAYYQEIDDLKTNLFFQFIPKGLHVFEYDLWVAQEGEFQDGIATLQCVYAPQFSAHSKSVKIEVKQ